MFVLSQDVDNQDKDSCILVSVLVSHTELNKKVCMYFFFYRSFFIYNFLTQASVLLSYYYLIGDIEQDLAILGIYYMPYLCELQGSQNDRFEKMSNSD